MSQASGILSQRGRFVRPSRSVAVPKRQLGIEMLERRCPMDASAAALGFDPEPADLANASPNSLPPVPAITSTLEQTPRSQGPDPRHVLPQHTQTQAKTVTVARRVAPARRPLAVDPLQRDCPQLAPAVTSGFDDDAEVTGGDAQLPLPPVPTDPWQPDDARGSQAAETQPEPPGSGFEPPENAHEGDGQLDPTITPNDPEISPDIKLPKDGLVDDPLGTTTKPADPDQDQPTDPSDPLLPEDVKTELEPLRFASPPGPEGSITLIPPGRNRNDQWTAGGAEQELDADSGVMPSATAARQTGYLRNSLALTQARYYESSDDGGDNPAEGFRSRTTPLRAFAREAMALDTGIAIEATAEPPAEHAAPTHWSSHAVSIEPQESSQDAAEPATETEADLAILAVVEEASEAEPFVPRASQSSVVATVVGLVRQEQPESIQTCSQDASDDAVAVALTPSQDFLINLSRWAALGLLVSHRISHQVACGGGLLSWMCGLRDRLLGSRARRR